MTEDLSEERSTSTIREQIEDYARAVALGATRRVMLDTAELCAKTAEDSAEDIGPENPAAKQAREIARLIRDHFSLKPTEEAQDHD